MPVQKIHAQTFARSALLSSYQMPQAIPAPDVIRVLNGAKISFVLAGAYGLAGWRKEVRGTEDVDIVVAARQVKKAVKVLLETFPTLEAVDLPVVVRLRERGTQNVLIEVMKPLQQPYLEVFKHAQTVQAEGLTYRIPSLEMALVMKFSAMTSLYRAIEDKYRDAHDFIRMVKNNPDLDTDQLVELACLLYAEGGKDILELVRKALAGESLQL